LWKGAFSEGTDPRVPRNPPHQATEAPEMTYHFYENWTVRPKKAKIHFSGCSFCNYGLGTDKPKEDGVRGVWHGPFATFEEARSAARRTGNEVTTCGHCKPR
jgi:hypothetical protein